MPDFFIFFREDFTFFNCNKYVIIKVLLKNKIKQNHGRSFEMKKIAKCIAGVLLVVAVALGSLVFDKQETYASQTSQDSQPFLDYELPRPPAQR